MLIGGVRLPLAHRRDTGSRREKSSLAFKQGHGGAAGVASILSITRGVDLCPHTLGHAPENTARRKREDMTIAVIGRISKDNYFVYTRRRARAAFTLGWIFYYFWDRII